MGKLTAIFNPVTASNTVAGSTGKKGGASMRDAKETARAMNEAAQEILDKSGVPLRETTPTGKETGASTERGTADPLAEAKAAARAASRLNPNSPDGGKDDIGLIFGDEDEDEGGTQYHGGASRTPTSGASGSGKGQAPAPAPAPTTAESAVLASLAESMSKLGDAVAGLGSQMTSFEGRMARMDARMDDLSKVVQRPTPIQRLTTTPTGEQDFLNRLAGRLRAEEKVQNARPCITGFWLGRKFYQDETRLKAAIRQATLDLSGEAAGNAIAVSYTEGYAFVSGVSNDRLDESLCDAFGAIPGAQVATEKDRELYLLRLTRERVSTPVGSSRTPDPASGQRQVADSKPASGSGGNSDSKPAPVTSITPQPKKTPAPNTGQAPKA